MSIESVHCFGNIEKMCAEVSSLLTSTGYFICADLFNKTDVAEFESKLSSELYLEKKIDITFNVKHALLLDTPRT